MFLWLAGEAGGLVVPLIISVDSLPKFASIHSYFQLIDVRGNIMRKMVQFQVNLGGRKLAKRKFERIRGGYRLVTEGGGELGKRTSAKCHGFFENTDVISPKKAILKVPIPSIFLFLYIHFVINIFE